MQYEYKVIPAPAKGRRAPGARSADARFAVTLEKLMNEMGTEGWEYQRADMLPNEERQGLTGTATVWRNVLVFRRARRQATENFEPKLLAPPKPINEPFSETDFSGAEPIEGNAPETTLNPALLARAKRHNAPTPLHPKPIATAVPCPNEAYSAEVDASVSETPDEDMPDEPVGGVQALRNVFRIGRGARSGNGRTGTGD